MRAPHSLRPYLIAAVLVCSTLPASAADLDKYLLDDANFVATINVKQIVQAPNFNQLEKQVEDLLKLESVQAVLKDTGFNPLKDIDLVLMMMGPKSLAGGEQANDPESSKNQGPMFLVQGRFDPEKIQARLAKFAEEMPEMVKIHGIGKANVAELKLPGQVFFGVLLDRNTLAVSPRRDEIEDLLEKAGGDRKTELKSPDLQRLLRGRDAKQLVHVAATQDAVIGGESSVRVENGKQVFTHKTKTLADFGMDSLVGSLTVGAKLQGKVVFTSKDAESAKKLGGEIETGLGQARGERARAIAMFKDLGPVFDFLDSVRVVPEEKSLTISGDGSPEALVAFIKSFFLARAMGGSEGN
jgi:hypothetical protein